MFFLFLTNPILIAAAVIPAVFLLVKVYRADELEKEPWPMLFSLIVYGVLATLSAMIIEKVFGSILGLIVSNDSLTYNFILFFIIVAFAEEGSKYFLLKRRTWGSQEFNSLFDGVVYAVFVSLGFALWENISYVLRFGMSAALIRAVTAVPGHACFGVFMGAWYGLARKYENMGKASEAKTFRVLSVLTPALLHGCYDFCATMNTKHSELIFIVFVIALFAAAFIVISRISKNDKYI